MRMRYVRAWPPDGGAAALKPPRTTRSPDVLEALITDIARRFANGVLEAVSMASFAEFVDAGHEVTRVPAGRTPATAPDGRKRQGRHPPVERNAEAIAQAVHDAGAAGIQAAALSEALGFTKSALNAAIRRAVETGLVRREGTKRGTRYLGRTMTN